MERLRSVVVENRLGNIIGGLSRVKERTEKG